MTPGPILTRVLAAAPLTPERDDAREWAERELSDPRYAQAEPTLLDRAARAVLRFLGGLFDGRLSPDWGPAAAIVVAIVAAALIVAALLIWDRPRRSTRLSPDRTPLFGDADERSAADLRRDAATAASASDWNDAIVLRFRALARGLAERTLVEVSAGTTVHGFARRATAVFPAESRRMDAAAAAFDDVRYLRRPGSEDAYRAISALDDDLARARPALAGVS